jgi:hypothetical protein
LEKIIGIQKHAGKVRKCSICSKKATDDDTMTTNKKENQK